MPASSTLLVDIATVITNGPNAASLAKAIVAAGPIMDYQANTKLAQLKLKEADVLLTAVYGVTASGDTANKAALLAILHALEGLSAPSTTLLTDIATVIATAPGATTVASAIAAAGPIMDYAGNLRAAQLKLKEADVLLGLIETVTDSSDSANLALIQSVALALA